MRMTLPELARVSRFARALQNLSAEQLRNGVDRIEAYPWDDFARLHSRAELCAIDAAALRAERLRRDLRVGHGFGARREAA